MGHTMNIIGYWAIFWLQNHTTIDIARRMSITQLKSNFHQHWRILVIKLTTTTTGIIEIWKGRMTLVVKEREGGLVLSLSWFPVFWICRNRYQIVWNVDNLETQLWCVTARDTNTHMHISQSLYHVVSLLSFSLAQLKNTTREGDGMLGGTTSSDEKRERLVI